VPLQTSMTIISWMGNDETNNNLTETQLLLYKRVIKKHIPCDFGFGEPVDVW